MLLVGLGAFVSAALLARLDGPRPGEMLRVAGILGVAIPVLALLAPRNLAAWDLARAEHWAVLSVAVALGVLASAAIGAIAAPRVSRGLRREEAIGLAVAIVAAGFVAASPSGALRIDAAGLEGACRGEMESGGSMPGMAGMEMDMAPLSAPDDCPEGAMAGMDGMAGMGGMDMRPAEREGATVAAPDARGGAPLAAVDPGDGVPTFVLRAGRLVWNILPDVQVGAYAYNDQLPGPLLKLTPNQSVRVRLENRLPENTTLHLHGLQIANDMDGVPYLEQRPVLPGETFDYEFRVPDTPGTYFYHSHFAADRQQALGLYGGIVIEGGDRPAAAADVPILLGEWTVMGDSNVATMMQPGMMPNFFTINGKSYPETDTVNVKVGDLVRLRVVGSGQLIHPMHLHGQPFTIVATDGNPVPEGARLLKDTVLVGPGERYDLEFVARAPGTWLFHCHINDHITNNGEEIEGGGGLTMRIVVAEA